MGKKGGRTEDKNLEEGILGTFPSPEETAKALEELKAAGLDDVTLYSPLDPGEMGLPVTKRKSRIGKFTVTGVVLGILGGLFIGGGTALLYPIATGGMPILSLPAIGLMTFEVMILFSLLATFSGFLYFGIYSENRKQFIPQCVTSDRFGISVQGNRKTLESAEKVLKGCGADRVEKQVARLWLGIVVAMIIPSLFLPSIVLGWPWSQDMVDQLARNPQEERVLTLPSTVPQQGSLIEVSKEEAPWMENPIPVTEASLRIGEELFGTFCVVCHGQKGKGDGLVAKKIGEFPDFTEKEFRSQPGGCFFVAMTNGVNFVSEVGRPRSSSQQVSHDDHEEAEHAHDEGAAHEHEEDEHQHDETASSEHEHNGAPATEHEDEDDPFGMGPTSDHTHDDEHEQHETSEHEHDEMASMEHDDNHKPESEHEHDEMTSMESEHDDGHEHETSEHEHADEHEHEHAGAGPKCGTGHEHGGGGGHKHGSGKKHFMPPYRDVLRPVERWHIVNFMKHGLEQE